LIPKSCKDEDTRDIAVIMQSLLSIAAPDEKVSQMVSTIRACDILRGRTLFGNKRLQLLEVFGQLSA